MKRVQQRTCLVWVTVYSVEHRVSFLVPFPGPQCSMGVWSLGMRLLNIISTVDHTCEDKCPTFDVTSSNRME